MSKTYADYILLLKTGYINTHKLGPLKFGITSWFETPVQYLSEILEFVKK